MNFRIKVIFDHFSCTTNGLHVKKLTHCYVNVKYKNISYYILFVFIILTCSNKKMALN